MNFLSYQWLWTTLAKSDIVYFLCAFEGSTELRMNVLKSDPSTNQRFFV